jgi:hypothetical protein
LLEDRRYTYSEFLEELSVPVLIVGSDGEIRAGNGHALHLFGKDRSEVVGHMGGEVIECAYSRLPGGCGQTPFCHNGCVIRRSVEQTYKNGESIRNALAVQRTVAGEAGEIEEKSYLISTERVGDVVFLRIEPAV